MGPARGDSLHWRFETLDLASFLHAGKNVVAAVAWNFAEMSPVAQMSSCTGFLLQGDTVDRYSFAFFIRSRAASVILFSAHPGFRRDPMT